MNGQRCQRLRGQPHLQRVRLGLGQGRTVHARHCHGHMAGGLDARPGRVRHVQRAGTHHHRVGQRRRREMLRQHQCGRLPGQDRRRAPHERLVRLRAAPPAHRLRQLCPLHERQDGQDLQRHTGRGAVAGLAHLHRTHRHDGGARLRGDDRHRLRRLEIDGLPRFRQVQAQQGARRDRLHRGRRRDLDHRGRRGIGPRGPGHTMQAHQLFHDTAGHHLHRQHLRGQHDGHSLQQDQLGVPRARHPRRQRRLHVLHGGGHQVRLPAVLQQVKMLNLRDVRRGVPLVHAHAHASAPPSCDHSTVVRAVVSLIVSVVTATTSTPSGP